ncbi:hypothetical protein ACS0TY_035366 [Phlomoides rotata]
MKLVDREIRRSNIPDWVECFLNMTFFYKCPIHDLQKNEVNRYCIRCNVAACKYCIISGDHDDHRGILTIYRHVYQNVVPLNEMENHFDCRRIQPYKCNKKWVVSLTPLPHNGSGSLIEGDGACYVCKRKLTDPDRFHFCSITCKVHSDLGRSVTNFPTPVINTSEIVEEEHNEVKSNKRRRKGVPRRAPFF